MPRVRRCDGLQMEQQQGTRNPLRLAVLKLGATEPAFTSPLHQETSAGRYECAGCGTTLFDSTGKYSCPCGWPSFYASAGEDLLQYKREWDGRIEVSCKCCNGHLGTFSPTDRVSYLMTVSQNPTPSTVASEGTRSSASMALHCGSDPSSRILKMCSVAIWLGTLAHLARNHPLKWRTTTCVCRVEGAIEHGARRCGRRWRPWRRGGVYYRTVYYMYASLAWLGNGP